MKLCKDCKHMVKGSIPFGATFPMCIHPSSPVDPVYGRKGASCELMRSTNCLVRPACGPNGEWFEQAPQADPPPKSAGTCGGTPEAKPDLGRSFWERLARWLD